MIIIVNPKAEKEQLSQLLNYLEEKHITVKTTVGQNQTILGLIGDTSVIDIDGLHCFGAVESAKRIQDPYKLVNRKFHTDDSIIDIDGIKIGGGNFQIIAGPCSVENEAQISAIAQSVNACGAKLLRGGAFKPRSSPYSFQGLKAEGLELLGHAKQLTHMPIVSEIMSIRDIDLFADVDVIQVGARNMQNFVLLQELGKCNKPILLKRGLSSTIEEFLMSAEYIMAGGNNNVILCERGIRTFETATRNTLDVSAIPVIKKLSHLPIIVDPSHACGSSAYVEALSFAAVAAGADGLIIEVHNNPKKALCDGAQSLDCDAFATLSRKIFALSTFMKNLD